MVRPETKRDDQQQAPDSYTQQNQIYDSEAFHYAPLYWVVYWLSYQLTSYQTVGPPSYWIGQIVSEGMTAPTLSGRRAL
jgi:hypothetical protein